MKIGGGERRSWQREKKEKIEFGGNRCGSLWEEIRSNRKIREGERERERERGRGRGRGKKESGKKNGEASREARGGGSKALIGSYILLRFSVQSTSM